jgi:hypothetical protein
MIRTKVADAKPGFPEGMARSIGVQAVVHGAGKVITVAKSGIYMNPGGGTNILFTGL